MLSYYTVFIDTFSTNICIIKFISFNHLKLDLILIIDYYILLDYTNIKQPVYIYIYID